MGAVWLATDELLNRAVAVKELLAAAAPHTTAGVEALEESRQRIMREGRIGARLRHAHVISMFDVVVHEDRPWLVMEYLASKSLSAVIAEKGPLSPSQTARIGRDVADGLAAAHLAGVVHRDVKPGNVLIGEEGEVKLTDFGVSRAVDEVQLTRTGLIAGTPAFLAPEIAQGRTPTAASDVFALGATLYATVEGIPPFGLDDNAYALLHKVATGVVNPPEHAGPLLKIMMWLLSADPDDRPSAAQARDALAAFNGKGVAGIAEVPADPGGPPTMADLSQPAPKPKPKPRSIRSVVLVAVLVVLVISGGALAAVLTNRIAADPGGAQVAAPPDTSVVNPPATSTAPAPEPTTRPVTPTPAPTTDAPAPNVSATAFIQRYYDLLPEDTGAAFALLSPSAQAASGGRSGFDGFYGTIASVSLNDVRSTGPNNVEATVSFVEKSGKTTNEPYRFVTATGDDGATVLESFSPA